MKNKQFIIIAMIMTMAFSIVGCGAKETFKAGTYTGESMGMKGPLKVEVTVTADEITDIKVLSHSESEGIGSVAAEELPKKIVETQSLKVEAVSGATSSSNTVIEAVENALEQSGADIAALKNK